MNDFMKGIIVAILMLCVSFTGCNKTGEALVGSDFSSQKIVLGQNENPEVILATTDMAGALGITKSAVDSDYPGGTNATLISDLIIIGTYKGGKFSNSLLSSYLTGDEFLIEGEAIILASAPDSPTRYAVIAGNTVDVTARAINIVKEYGLDGSYADQLGWGFVRVRSIVPHCFDQYKNADEGGVDCGGSCAACVASVIQTTRTLPPDAQIGTLFTVTINLDLDDNGTDTVAVEETLPSGCTLQGSTISSLDATTPTWIFDDSSLPLPTNPRVDTTFSYGVVCTTLGAKTFSGQVSTKSGSIVTKGHSSIII
jgi:hypothetical protein